MGLQAARVGTDADTMPILLRLRTRDGTERLQVEDTCTLRELREAIETQLRVPESDQTLSLRQELLLSKGDLSEFDDLKPGRKNDGKKLKALGVEHGAMVYLRYSVARDPTPTMAAQHRSELKGGKMTVESMIAAQTRIESQANARCASVSLDARCANQFQSYVNNTLGFAQMRFGWMYGVEESGVTEPSDAAKESSESSSPKIVVHAIYEPEQEGGSDRFDPAARSGEEDARAENRLGARLKKSGHGVQHLDGGARLHAQRVRGADHGGVPGAVRPDVRHGGGDDAGGRG